VRVELAGPLAVGVKLYADPTVTVVDGVPEIESAAGTVWEEVPEFVGLGPKLDTEPHPASRHRQYERHAACGQFAGLTLSFTVIAEHPAR